MVEYVFDLRYAVPDLEADMIDPQRQSLGSGQVPRTAQQASSKTSSLHL